MDLNSFRISVAGCALLGGLALANIDSCQKARGYMQQGHDITTIEKMVRETPVRVKSFEEFSEKNRQSFQRLWDEGKLRDDYSSVEDALNERHETYLETVEMSLGSVREDDSGNLFAYSPRPEIFVWLQSPGRKLAYTIYRGSGQASRSSR